MNLIIPMAGRGKRLRPHTLTTPKPLIPVAGKPIVQRLVEDIAAVTPEPIENIAFVVGHFGEAVEEALMGIAKQVRANGHIIYQEEALGTAHAVYCAEQWLNGKVSVAFADTLFRAECTLDTEQDGIIWVKEIDDPSSFGVVKTNKNGIITDFVEKPSTPVSRKAIIGIYYFKSGEALKEELKFLIDNDIRGGGEFQLTTALENLKDKGTAFRTGTVSEWLDCGNKNVTVHSNAVYLSLMNGSEQLVFTENIENCEIIPPVYIGEGAILKNSKVGPGVSIGPNARIESSIIRKSLIQSHCEVEASELENTMLGNYVIVRDYKGVLSAGDYSTIG
jgi:glucose-1-phosphate thymidylyltransferase